MGAEGPVFARHAQLADFGLTRVLDVDKRTHISTQTYGTVAYMPPGARLVS